MKEKIEKMFDNQIHDMLMNIFFYDRKMDRELPPGVLEEYFRAGVVNIDDVVEMFRTQLKREVRLP